MKRIRRSLFHGIAALSLALCLGSTINLWRNGVDSQPHGVRISLPVPSDADEILVIGLSKVEHWEYAPWDKKWYLMSGGPLVTISLGILPLAWAWRFRRESLNRLPTR
jgi:hypothetical protein